MKIKEVTKIICFLIETDDEYRNEYTRYSEDNWTVRIGESDEPLHNCEEIESLYQDWLAKTEKSKPS